MSKGPSYSYLASDEVNVSILVSLCLMHGYGYIKMQLAIVFILSVCLIDALSPKPGNVYLIPSYTSCPLPILLINRKSIPIFPTSQSAN